MAPTANWVRRRRSAIPYIWRSSMTTRCEHVISKGRQGTPMAAFAESAGGMLTDKQVDAIIQGMRQRWGQPRFCRASAAPPYAAKAPGNAQQGTAAYATFCASCHGADGKGSATVGSIVDRNYLSLISDQGLRTTRDHWPAGLPCARLARTTFPVTP